MSRKSKIWSVTACRKQTRFVCAIFILPVLLCGPAIAVIACLNPIGRETVGTQIELNGLSAQDLVKSLVTREDRTYWAGILSEIKQDAKVRPHLVSENNIAVALVHLGQVKEAIGILERLERQDPGDYTAANLGTAYELNGQNDKALQWIKEGVRRNSQDHYGTEWLHVKILEAKIALERDPQWLDTHSVLGVDFRTDRTPGGPVFAVDELGHKRTLAKMESALVYQLHERMEFVRPPEPVVADLLFDLSSVLLLTRTPDHSAAVREIALSYGPGQKRNAIKVDPADASPAVAEPLQSSYIFAGMAALIIIGAASAVYFLIIKKRRNLV